MAHVVCCECGLSHCLGARIPSGTRSRCGDGVSCLLGDLELHWALSFLLHYDCPRGNALAVRDVAHS
jgi:hypothetical protein